MTLKRDNNGQQVVTFGPTEKLVFGVVTTLIASGIVGLITMQFQVTADIAAIKEQIKAVDRRVQMIEDHK